MRIFYCLYICPVKKKHLFYFFFPHVLEGRRALFRSSSILSHTEGIRPTAFANKRITDSARLSGNGQEKCTSYFIEPVEWMEPALLGVMEGQVKWRIHLGFLVKAELCFFSERKTSCKVLPAFLAWILQLMGRFLNVKHSFKRKWAGAVLELTTPDRMLDRFYLLLVSIMRKICGTSEACCALRLSLLDSGKTVLEFYQVPAHPPFCQHSCLLHLRAKEHFQFGFLACF